MELNYETLLEDNYKYFKEEILNYHFFLYTYSNQCITVRVSPDNLMHLLGIQYGRYIYGPNVYGELFFKRMDNPRTRVKSIFSLIDKERFFNQELSREERFIVEKNEQMIPLFESLIYSESNHKNIRLFRKVGQGDFDADYLYLKISDESNKKVYLGIIGEDESDYFRFNSILVRNEKGALGTPIRISKIQRVPNEKLEKMKWEFLPSPRNRKRKKNKSKKGNKTLKQVLKTEYRFIQRKIRKIDKNLIIVRGSANIFSLKQKNQVLWEDLSEIEGEANANTIINFIQDLLENEQQKR